jgi:hypothetical protein
MKNTVLIVLSVRNIKSVKDHIDNLNCEKIWFKGYREHELSPLLNRFVQDTNFENYFIAPDDLIIKSYKFDRLVNALNRFDIVSGWGVIRQNATYTTITKPQDFLKNTIFKPSFINTTLNNSVYKHNYQTHEIYNLPEEIETAFTGWFYTGMKRNVLLEYPYECVPMPNASSDLTFSRRVLSDKKYKLYCIKSAHVTHISHNWNLRNDKSFMDMNSCFNNKSIESTFSTGEKLIIN